jgi:hypothetical protein
MRRSLRHGSLIVGLLVQAAVSIGQQEAQAASPSPALAPQAMTTIPFLIPIQEVGDPDYSTGDTDGETDTGQIHGGGGDGIGAPAEAPIPGSGLAAPQTALTPQVTQAIADSLGDAFDACRTLAAGYQIDCMGQQLRATAAQVAPTGAYAEVNRALTDAARKLDAIARRDRDSGQTRISVQHRRQSGIKTYSAVRPAALAQSRADAARVLDEVQTVLLRSAANSGNRRSHFQRIAATMDSGKVLLRSG